MRFVRIAFAVLVLAATAPVNAVEPDEILSDSALEARARDLSTELRCLVCQNQSIDDSDAPLAKDLRVLIRERLVVGDTNGQVIDFVVARYGEFVLLRPRFAPHTWALWLGPPVVFLLGAGLIFASYRRRRREARAAAPEPLTEEERRRLKELTSD
ncbi:MAG: cytochrome c-type biogenesis protein [Hyphomicrobiales bacterium]